MGERGEERERVGIVRKKGERVEDRKTFLVQFILLSPPYRAMKDEDADAAAAPAGKPRPLYDIPYMFEAREFLRKKLIGKKV